MAETESRFTSTSPTSVTTEDDSTTTDAVVQSVYGGPEVLEFAEVERPTPDDEALVRVVAASVAAGDWHLIRGTPFPIRHISGGYCRPKFPISGVDIAGGIEAIGRNVTTFQPGDEVIAEHDHRLLTGATATLPVLLLRVDKYDVPCPPDVN